MHSKQRVSTRAMVGPEHEVPPEIAADIRRADPRLRSDLQQAVAQLDYTDEIEIVRSLSQPIAIFHGRAEALINGAYLERLAIPTLWRGAVQWIDGAGHYAQLERPEAFDTLVDTFAQSCS